MNPGWTYKLWTDAESDAFVRKYFSQYWGAYSGLEKRIEKADFFRRAAGTFGSRFRTTHA